MSRRQQAQALLKRLDEKRLLAAKAFADSVSNLALVSMLVVVVVFILVRWG